MNLGEDEIRVCPSGAYEFICKCGFVSPPYHSAEAAAYSLKLHRAFDGDHIKGKEKDTAEGPLAFECTCGTGGLFVNATECKTALDQHKSVCFAPMADASKAKEDAVNHPSHYQGKVETIDAIESACAGIGPDAFKGYLTGNIVKYMSRWSRKGGAQDLKKAAWYLAKLLEVVKP